MSYTQLAVALLAALEIARGLTAVSQTATIIVGIVALVLVLLDLAPLVHQRTAPRP